MALCRSESEKKKINNRIRRIKGQLNAAENMINNDAECIEVLRLLNSAEGALKGVWTQVLNDHLKGCIAGALAHNDPRLVDELIEHLKKLR